MNNVKIKEINMLNDAMFKALFRSIEARSVVASFLSSLTGIDVKILMEAEYQGGELPKKILKEKGKTSDIIIKIDDGNKIIVEMNQKYSDKIFEKNTSYAFSIASETVLAGTKKYPKVILINFDNFNYFKTDEAILNFKLRDEFGHIETEQYHSIHLVLDNIVNLKYNKDDEVNKLVRLLKTKSIDEMEEEFKGDGNYMACVRRVEELSTDPNFVGYYDIEEARRQDLEDSLETGLRMGREEGLKLGIEKGIEEGIEQGIEQGISNRNIEIAKSMLKKDFNIDLIAELTNLSLDEIDELR